ncbi:MAG TPA: 5-deoxy-glucuronate isomerase [Actinomycetota bacterium]|jgi:5-deoxy-glucuronate isomerase
MTADLLRPAGSLAADGDPVTLTPEDAGWSFAGLRVMALATGERRVVRLERDEAAVLPLAGSCAVEVGGRTFELEGRDDVFSRVSDFAYLPLGTEAVLSSHGGAEVALPTARAERALEPAHVPARSIPVEVRGGGAATRQVTNFLAADAFEADRLIAVEVLTPDGNWSSFPPHKHDEHTEREVPLEEVYYFRVRGRNGFGLHRTYTLDGEIDETVTVRGGDVFLVPRGYHGPCVAAPGHAMYYLNVMAGPAERAWRACTDPAHEWLWELFEALGPDPRCPMTTADGPAEGSSRR